jgi:hypothetical protein
MHVCSTNTLYVILQIITIIINSFFICIIFLCTYFISMLFLPFLYITMIIHLLHKTWKTMCPTCLMPSDKQIICPHIRGNHGQSTSMKYHKQITLPFLLHSRKWIFKNYFFYCQYWAVDFHNPTLEGSKKQLSSILKMCYNFGKDSRCAI